MHVVLSVLLSYTIHIGIFTLTRKPCCQGWGDYIANVIEYEYDYFEIVRVRVRVRLLKKWMYLSTITITFKSNHDYNLDYF